MDNFWKWSYPEPVGNIQSNLAESIIANHGFESASFRIEGQSYKKGDHFLITS